MVVMLNSIQNTPQISGKRPLCETRAPLAPDAQEQDDKTPAGDQFAALLASLLPAPPPAAAEQAGGEAPDSIVTDATGAPTIPVDAAAQAEAGEQGKITAPDRDPAKTATPAVLVQTSEIATKTPTMNPDATLPSAGGEAVPSTAPPRTANERSVKVRTLSSDVQVRQAEAVPDTEIPPTLEGAGADDPSKDPSGGSESEANPQDARIENADPVAFARGTVTQSGAANMGADAAVLAAGDPSARTGLPSQHAIADDTFVKSPDIPVESLRHNIQHITDAARHIGRGTVEITLTPEELGQVRLTVKSHDTNGATIILQADRPETLDLMRRHVELLAQEMRDIGYGELTFTFQDRDQSGSNASAFAQNADDTPAIGPQAAKAPVGRDRAPLRPSGQDGRLDIRI
jgi:flagellar hook-length control protein FliK